LQAVAGRHQPLHVGREAQVVRIDDAAHGALHFGGARVDEGQRIGQRVGDDDRLLVRRHVQVVRLLARGNALDLAPAGRIDHADVGVQRVQHEDGRGLDDEYGTLRQLDEIALAAPHARQLRLAACGHSPQRDQPGQTVEAIADFLKPLAGLH
jgi:pimeloyl-ACP methyl ester carboxylesterase